KAAQPDETPTPVKTEAKQVIKEPPAVVLAKQTVPDKTPPTQSAPVVQEPSKREPVKTATSQGTPAQPETTENTVTIQPDTPPAHVIAATSKAPGTRRSMRPILLTGIIVLAGVLGARAWFSDNDTADIAAVQDGAGTAQISPVTAKPSIEVTTSAASEQTAKPATAATQTTSWSPAPHPELPEPASTLETLPTVAATPPATAVDEAVATESPQQQATAQTTAAAPQLTRPVAPQPAYYAPSYGYYPQQPVRQQPHYPPGYSR
ncbi:MAG TPA: hypothetical protein DCO71_01050, partial [Gammaproteobacteria bacterium]|nr:hypothetical protein [Gammaproteobacteria bacterium]